MACWTFKIQIQWSSTNSLFLPPAQLSGQGCRKGERFNFWKWVGAKVLTVWSCNAWHSWVFSESAAEEEDLFWSMAVTVMKSKRNCSGRREGEFDRHSGTPLPVSSPPATAHEHHLANTTETSTAGSHFQPFITSTAAGLGFVRSRILSMSVLTGSHWKISFKLWIDYSWALWIFYDSVSKSTSPHAGGIASAPCKPSLCVLPAFLSFFHLPSPNFQNCLFTFACKISIPFIQLFLTVCFCQKPLSRRQDTLIPFLLLFASKFFFGVILLILHVNCKNQKGNKQKNRIS